MNHWTHRKPGCSADSLSAVSPTGSRQEVIFPASGPIADCQSNATSFLALAAGDLRALTAEFLEQGWSDLIKQILQAATVSVGLADHRHQCQRHIKASATPAMGEVEHPRRVFVPPRASGAVFPNTGLAHFSQGSLERGPEGLEPGLPFFSCWEGTFHMQSM